MAAQRVLLELALSVVIAITLWEMSKLRKTSIKTSAMLAPE